MSITIFLLFINETKIATINMIIKPKIRNYHPIHD